MPDLNVVDLIVAKRDGAELEPSQIHSLVDAYTRGDVPDYQMSAFLMAAFLRGFSGLETFALTEAMLASGTVIDLSAIPGAKVDKHSTGGVGDKISLILAPVVAACGVPVPMISGRALGFTGGTLDKLESITGFRTDLSTREYEEQLSDLGVVLIGQTDEVAPADRSLYALRDVTGTVEFIPFIASSILSKKLAEGIDALVLDVKCGRGAFMKEESTARQLAETLVDIGEYFDTRTVALMTRMDVPLGRTVGNWPEIVETVQCLQGADVPDVMELVAALAGEMIALGGRAESAEEGRAKASEAIVSGAAYDMFRQVVERQGGDVSLLNDPEARRDYEPAGTIEAAQDGFVIDLDALTIGQTATVMGSGRMKKEQDVDPLAGIVLNKTVGDPVSRGDVLATLYTRHAARVPEYAERVGKAYTIGASNSPPRTSVLIDRYASERWQIG